MANKTRSKVFFKFEYVLSDVVHFFEWGKSSELASGFIAIPSLLSRDIHMYTVWSAYNGIGCTSLLMAVPRLLFFRKCLCMLLIILYRIINQYFQIKPCQWVTNTSYSVKENFNDKSITCCIYKWNSQKWLETGIDNAFETHLIYFERFANVTFLLQKQTCLSTNITHMN